MYSIEKKQYGYKLTFADQMDACELYKWLAESEKILNGNKSSFGVLVDMSRLKPLSPDAQTPMERGQKFYKESGMERSAVMLENVMIKMQFIKIAKETGIYDYERYFVGDEQAAVDWIINGKEPEN